MLSSATPGMQVIVPNPKTSGNSSYTYLAAWGYALEKSKGEAVAKDFVAKLFANVPVLDGRHLADGALCKERLARAVP